jgi:transposase
MGGRGELAVDEAGRAELEHLGRSAARREADRARAVLWSLDGETSVTIALALGGALGRGLGAARPSAAGTDPAQARGSARGGPRPAGGPGRRPAGVDAGPARGRDPGPHRGDGLAGSPEPGAAKGGYRWRRPRHTLKGRQDSDAVDRAGLRLKLLKQQAAAGDIHLLFGDESEALTHPYLAHCWAERGADLRVEAPGRAKRRALLGALDHARGELIVVTSATKRSGDFVDLLRQLEHAYGPAPRREDRPVVLVLDNGPIHTSKAATAALAARPWLRVEWLPKYAPELNAIERSWRDLKRHYLAHRTFRDADQLDHAIHQAVDALNRERRPEVCAVISDAA